MLACTKNNRAMVELFIKKGASVLLRNKDGWTPFHLACRYAGRLVARLRMTACLFYANREGHVDIITLLLDHDNTSWATVSKNKRTPLHTAGMLRLIVVYFFT